MVRSLGAIAFLAIFLCAAIANGQDKKEIEKELKRLDGIRDEKIKNLLDVGKSKTAKDINTLREQIGTLRKKANPDSTVINDLTEKHNTLVAKYNVELPKFSKAANEATRIYNAEIEKYNSWVATYNAAP